MKAFLARSALFVVLQALLLVPLEAFYRRRVVEPSFLAAWNDKHARLASAAPPRVLLVGGSNWAFGVDSPTLERLTGRPVVNLGLNAGLGRELTLRPAEEAAAPGDVVVLSLEYEFFLPAEVPSATTVWSLLDAAPDAARYVPLRDWPALLDAGLNHLAKRPQAFVRALRGRETPDDIYARKAFNRRGDVVAHRGRHGGLGPDRHVRLTASMEDARAALARLARFTARVHAAGGRAFLTAPPMPEDDRAAQAERLAAFWERLREIPDLRVLEREPAGVPRDHFYDSPYHLRTEAARARTERLFAALRPWLSTSATP
jgi:hypothetical protein